MLKTLLMLCLAFALSMGAAWAAVDVNTGDQPALESVKGLGPVKSKAIIDERTKNGPFKNADDLADRVKGLGTKSVANLEEAGLTIGGSSAPPTGRKPTSRTAGAGTGSNTSASAQTDTGADGTNTRISKRANKSGAPVGSTIKSTPAATAATSPAATTQTTPAAAPGSSSAKTATATTASPDAASSPVAKASKKSRKKKAKAASDAATGQ